MVERYRCTRQCISSKENFSRYMQNGVQENEETEYMLDVCVCHLPASQQQLAKYSKTDPVCSSVMTYCKEGWPDKLKVHPILKPYWKVQGEFPVHNRND